MNAFTIFLLLIAFACPAELFSQSAAAAQKDSAQALYKQAQRHHKRNEFATVVELCRKAVSLYPEFTEAHRELVDHVENRDSLRAAYEKLHASHPKSPVFSYLLGRLAESVDEKEAHFRKSLAADSTYAWAHIGMGWVGLQRQDPDAAIRAYGRAAELDPQNVTAYQGLALAYNRSGRPEEAKKVYERMLAAMPDRIDGYFALAGYFRQRGEMEKARDYYRLAYERFQSDPENAAEALYWYADAMPDTIKAVEMYREYLNKYQYGPRRIGA